MPKNVKDDKSILRKPKSSQFIFFSRNFRHIFGNVIHKRVFQISVLLSHLKKYSYVRNYVKINLICTLGIYVDKKQVLELHTNTLIVRFV